MYRLDDILHFGKYEGWTIKQIYCGQKYISQRFLNDFLEFKLAGAKFEITDYTRDLTKKDVTDVEIKDFEVLINNELTFELALTYKESRNIPEYNSVFSSAIDWINWDLVLDDRPEAKDIFESPNKIINSINEINSTYYFPSSDADYINWCLKNLDTFFLNPEDILKLQSEICSHFYGIKLSASGFDNIYKYEPTVVYNTFKFDEEAIVLNREKFEKKSKAVKPTNSSNSNNNQGDNYDHLYDPQYEDGYGGYHDNSLIDDAFEGDPDNYWNID